MVQLSSIQKQADQLSQEDKKGLLAYLIQSLPDAPQDADDAEVMRREMEMDSGTVKLISHEEFLHQVRGSRR